MPKKSNKKSYPVRASDVPVTQGMFYRAHEELKAEIRGHDKRFKSVDSKFDSVDARFDAVDARFDSVDRRFDSLEARMDSRFDKMSAEIHSIKLLVEEQNAKNNIVLDGLTNLFARQERIENVLLNLK